MDSVDEDTGCPHDVIGEKAHESFRPVRAQGETEDGLLARASGEPLKRLGSRCSKAVESSSGEQTSTPASDFTDSADVEFTLRKEELFRLVRGLEDWQTPADQAVSIEFRLRSQILELVSQQRGLLLQMGERLQQATSQLDLSQQLGTKQQEQADDHFQTTERISEQISNLERRLEKTQRQLEPLTGARLHASLSSSRSFARSKPFTLEEVDRMMPGDPQRTPTSPRLQRGGSSSDNAAASADAANASKPATLGRSCIGEVDSTAKATARKRLRGAWQAGGLPALDAAIEEGERLGLRDCELEAARKKRAREVKVERARQRLANAMQAKSADMLKAAIQHASGLPKGEVHAAKQLLSELNRQREARSRLNNAVTSRGIGKLRAAIADGEAAGLNEDLENARGLLKEEEEHKAYARRRLRQAVGSRDIDAFRAAIANGDAVGLPEDDKKAAQRMIADLEQELKMKVVNSLAEADKKRDQKEAHGSEKLKMKVVSSLAEADKKRDEKEAHGSEKPEMKVVSSLAEADKTSEEKEAHGSEEARGRRGAEDGEEEEACGSEEASGRGKAKDGEEEKAPAAKSSVQDHDDDDTEYDRVNHLTFGCFAEVRWQHPIVV